MSTKDKLIERFTRVRLERGSDYYNLHRPHPTPIIKPGALKAAYAYLKRLKLI